MTTKLTLSREQLLQEIKNGLVWLSEYKGKRGAEYSTYKTKLIGAISTYLGWYDRKEFLTWLKALDIEDELKQLLIRYFGIRRIFRKIKMMHPLWVSGDDDYKKRIEQGLEKDFKELGKNRILGEAMLFFGKEFVDMTAEDRKIVTKSVDKTIIRVIK